MKKFTSLLIVAGAAVGMTGIARAELPVSAMTMGNEPYAAASVKKAPASGPGFKLEASPRLNLTVGQGELGISAQASRPIAKAPALRAGVATSELGGYYVEKYSTLTSSSFDGGATVQVVPDAEGDSVTIKYFWNGCDVRAHVDATTGTVTVPSQYVMTDATYGALNIATANTDGSPDYATQITGRVTSDGGIDFASAWWGIYVQTGTNKDRFVGAYYNLTLSKP